MNNKSNIVIATGGTGGHVFPSIGLANCLNDEYKVQIFTDERGLKYFRYDKNLKVKKIISSRVFSKNIFYFFTGILKIFISIFSSLKLLIELKPKIIIGMGGYSSFAVCLSGFILRIPILIYENNLVIGRANRLLLPISKKILVSSKNIRGINKKYENKIFFTGFLLRKQLVNSNIEKFQINKSSLSLLIIGGSQSAKIFGDQIPLIIKKCHANDIKFNIYQQCQESQTNYIKKIYENLNIKFELFSFTDDLSKYYEICDIAITRCGASSMAELVNSTIPFIAVPLPSSMDNHQLRNAEYFYEKGYCFLLEQKYLLEKLFDILQTAHKDRDKLYLYKQKMSKHSDKESLTIAKNLIKETINGKI